MIKNNSKFLTRVCLALLCLVTVTISACKKDNSGSSGSGSQTTNLTSGTWRLTKIESKQQNGNYVDVTDPQTLDVITFQFSSDNTYIGKDNNTTTSGTWKFSNDGSELIMTHLAYGSNVTVTFTILTLNGSTLQWFDTGVQQRDTFTK